MNTFKSVFFLSILLISGNILSQHQSRHYNPPSPYQGSYLVFDGYNDFIRMDHIPDLDLNTSVTTSSKVELRFRVQVLDNRNSQGTSMMQCIISQCYLNGWYVYYEPQSNHIRFLISNTDGTTQDDLDFCALPDHDSFHTYKFVYDRTTGIFETYLDGSLTNSYSSKFWNYVPFQIRAFAIGARNISTGYGEDNLNAFNYFHGYADDVALIVDDEIKFDINFSWGAGQYAMDGDSYFVWDRAQPGSTFCQLYGFYFGATWGYDKHDPSWGPVSGRLRVSPTHYSTLGKGFTTWTFPPEPVETWLANTVTYHGSLYATGSFNRVNGDTIDNGLAANGIAKWNESTGIWETLGQGLDGYGLHVNIWNDKLIVTGRFSKLGDGTPVNNIVAWNGSSWTAFGSGLTSSNQDAYGFVTAEYQGNLIAGGTFNTAGGNPANLIARWDGQNWYPMGSGFENSACNSVSALAVYKGELYAGGTFVMTGGSTVLMGLAKWNGNNWVSAENHVPPNINIDRSFQVLYVYDDKLWTSGLFAALDGVTCNNIAYYDKNNDSWHSIGTENSTQVGLSGQSVLSTGGEATDMVSDGVNLYIAGSFTKVNGIMCQRVAKYSPKDNSWGPLGYGVDLRPEGLSIYRNHLVITGDLYSADGIDVHNIALYDLSGGNIQPPIENNGTVPDKFRVYQNYPNPFNPDTHIKFETAASGVVTVRIYDISGRLVSELMNESLQPGVHEIGWNGSQFSSGAYFCRVSAGSESTVLKMLMVK